jgi:hypothetical protein
MRRLKDGVTDENPYLGGFSDEDRVAYGEALMSGVDEKVVKRVEGQRVLGSWEFESTLKMERGWHRVKRGKPARRVSIAL